LSKEAVSASSSQIPTPISTAPTVPSTPALKYATLASFSWDQDDDKVKVRMKLNAEKKLAKSY
jgi:calcyclin binding protein